MQRHNLITEPCDEHYAPTDLATHARAWHHWSCLSPSELRWGTLVICLALGNDNNHGVDIGILPLMSYVKLCNYLYCPSRRQREATEGPLETTGDHRGQSRAQILARAHKPKFPPTPPGPPSYASLGDKMYKWKIIILPSNFRNIQLLEKVHS